MPEFPLLSGFDFSALIYQGRRSRVYRAQRCRDKRPVIIKLLNQTHPRFQALEQFRHQFDSVCDLDLQGIVIPLDILPYENQFALVMPDEAMISLHEFLGGQILCLKDFFPIAIELTDILGQLHTRGLIHKDIKPGNIIIHPQTQRLKLIDFCLSTLFSHEQPSISAFNQIEGTLAYLSPEQTGRMNRELDYRSDYYSLGVTLYECLTATTPFNASDPLAMVHSHIARTPPAPTKHNSQIPGILSELILKLLSKEPDERYQSSEGLIADLQHCQQHWLSQGSIPPFRLGQIDRSRRLNIPEKLYARQAAVQQLLRTFDQAAQGQAQWVLLRGPSGIGKTALVNEVHKPMTRERGYFIRGKFDQYLRDTPYSAIAQAFNQLMEQLLQEDEPQQQRCKSAIQQALGQQAQVLIDIIPKLQTLVGPQPPVTVLEGEAATNRFQFLFIEFMRVFSQTEHPLILFLDDLQWVDPASLKLLETIIQSEQAMALLLLGAYRDNEVNAAHPLAMTIHHLQQAQQPLTELTLKALEQSQLNQMLADLCGSAFAHTQSLCQRIWQKTAGNPFYIHRFIKLLMQQQCFTYNTQQGHWDYQLGSVEELSASSSVVEFIAWQLRKLPHDSQSMLQMAACLGNHFDVVMLAKLLDKDLSTCIKALWPTLNNNWLQANHEQSQVFQHPSQAERLNQVKVLMCHFRHDRIQEAAYSLIDSAQRPHIHLKIGRLLQNFYDLSRHPEKIFEITAQLNQGQALIQDPQEQRALAQLNLRAAQRAQAATAYTSAREFYRQGIERLGESAWQKHYHLTLQLYEGLVACAALQSDYNAQAQWSIPILQYAHELLDTIKTHQWHCISLIAQNKAHQAIDYARPILSQLGITLPKHPNKHDFQQYLADTQALIKEVLEGRPIAALSELPPMTDKRAMASLYLLSKLNVAFYTTDTDLYPIAIFLILQLSLRHGQTQEMIPHFAAYGFILSTLMDDIDTGYTFAQLALTLVDKFQVREQKALTLIDYTFSHNFKRPLRTSLPYLNDAMYCGQQYGDLNFASSAALWMSIFSFFSGIELPRLATQCQQYRQFIGNMKRKIVLNYHCIHSQVISNLLGELKDVCLLNGDIYNEEQMLGIHQQANDNSAMALLYVYKLFLAYLFQNLDMAKANSKIAEQNIHALMGSFCVPFFQFYHALTLLAIFPKAHSEDKTAIIKKVTAYQQKMRLWADHAPMNFAHKWALVEAERLRITEEPCMAMDYYDQAIEGAIKHQYIQEAALASELAARFYNDWGKNTIASVYMEQAYYHYARWGARSKVVQLTRHYPGLLTRVLSENSPVTQPNPHGITQESTDQATLDVQTLIKASQSLSGQRSVDALMQDLLTLMLEHAGAHRCLLLLKQDTQVQDARNQNATSQTTQWRLAGESLLDQKITCQLPDLAFDQYRKAPHQLLGSVMNKQQALVLDNTRDPHQRFINDPYFQQNHGVKSVICQPILNQNRLLGLIYLENNLTTQAFNDKLQNLTGMLAAQAAISLENALLYEHLEDKVKQRTAELEQAKQAAERLARTDPLTGVCNRRAFFDSGQAELLRAQRYKRYLSLIMLDIDHFKSINDNYGHGVGDEAIKALVRVIQKNCRSNDILGRLGGEEFAIILPETQLPNAKMTAERIRQTLEQQILTTGEHRLSYSASFGVTFYTALEDASPSPQLDNLLEQADQALYEAKEHGRNQVVIFHKN